ncbi:hypothetical protein BOX15_Mlig030621g1 [Macrostomum lignano]|uniref:Uncharacterized protein n=2 Tax=Macrostomum lignano TaxID=282301 RepID=A0A267F9P3_9PLAT|nr:hypothetical protein BOX15_Mlig030130g1 [Macrostomum lignano]PAA69722.1 hypothetical protein BOX15_Mlig030621g1 [Macrostomum lignano]
MASGGDCPDENQFNFNTEGIPDIPVRDSAEAEESGGGDSEGDHPLTPRVFCEPESPPDTEENVRRQTDTVFQAFVFERYTRDREQGRLQPGAPSSPELILPPADPLSVEAGIGRRLAEIGDEIQQRYQPEFDEMIKSLDGQLTDPASSFDTFRRVARRLFHDGSINWGRIVALFCFGYRIAVEKIRRGVSGFLRNVVQWIFRFLVQERIARWIADHGGWRSVTHMAIQTLDMPLLMGLCALAASLCFVAYRLSRR